MQFLILGGTGWLSGVLARLAVAGGHHVTCANRSAGGPPGATSFRADRDEAGALAPLAASDWDAVIDVARQPGHVRSAVVELADATRRYLLVSTISVYARSDQPGADESAQRLPALEADTMAGPQDYGSAKVACEDAVLAGFGAERSLIARPGLIGGPGDPTGRTDYWPWRFAHPARAGQVLVPDALDLPTAVLDVRDLAAWLVRCAEQGTTGIANALGEVLPLAEHLAIARQAAGSSARSVPAPREWLRERGVGDWAGPRSLPLWVDDPAEFAMDQRSVQRALTSGLARRPLLDTLRDGLAWRASQANPDDRGAGLTVREEQDLLQELDAPSR